MTVKSTIATKIIDIRLENKLTQTEFGEKLGVTAAAVSKWENEVNSVEIDVLLKICEVFDISLKALLGSYGKFCDLTDFEANLLFAYHKRTNMQEAVKTLLGINKERLF